jgi:hypothetical protein
MSTSNRFSALFKEPSLDKHDSTLESELKSEQNISAKKTPIKIMLGHRSYEDELREKDAYYDKQNCEQRTSAYEILADKEKLASSLAKSKMCSSVGKNEECQHGENCRFAHSLDELKISNCLFEQRCRFVRMSNGTLVNNGEKVCFHKHPHETKETFMSRTGLDRYKCTQACAQPSVERKTQPTVAQVDQPRNPLAFWQPPPHVSVWHSSPPIPPPTVDPPLSQPLVDEQTNTVPEKLNDATTSDQILVIRVPKELANQALEIAMKSGKTRIQIEVIN